MFSLIYSSFLAFIPELEFGVRLWHLLWFWVGWLAMFSLPLGHPSCFSSFNATTIPIFDVQSSETKSLGLNYPSLSTVIPYSSTFVACCSFQGLLRFSQPWDFLRRTFCWLRTESHTCSQSSLVTMGGDPVLLLASFWHTSLLFCLFLCCFWREVTAVPQLISWLLF